MLTAEDEPTLDMHQLLCISRAKAKNQQAHHQSTQCLLAIYSQSKSSCREHRMPYRIDPDTAAGPCRTSLATVMATLSGLVQPLEPVGKKAENPKLFLLQCAFGRNPGYLMSGSGRATKAPSCSVHQGVWTIVVRYFYGSRCLRWPLLQDGPCQLRRRGILHRKVTIQQALVGPLPGRGRSPDKEVLYLHDESTVSQLDTTSNDYTWP